MLSLAGICTEGLQRKEAKCRRSHGPCGARGEQLAIPQPGPGATRWPLPPHHSRHYSDSLSPVMPGSKASAVPRAQLLLALRTF